MKTTILKTLAVVMLFATVKSFAQETVVDNAGEIDPFSYTICESANGDFIKVKDFPSRVPDKNVTLTLKLEGAVQKLFAEQEYEFDNSFNKVTYKVFDRTNFVTITVVTEEKTIPGFCKGRGPCIDGHLIQKTTAVLKKFNDETIIINCK